MRLTPRTPLFELDEPLSQADVGRYCEELGLLQGNILKSHGRELATNIFMTFKKGRLRSVQEFLRGFATCVTSARRQEEQSREFHQSGGHKSELFVGVHLTAAGYLFLGHSIAGFSQEFADGLRGARARLGDPPIAEWEAHYRRRVHAMVTLAHDYASELARELRDMLAEVDDFASTWIERGVAMRNADGRTVEHFGFVDGVSQPLFFSKDVWSEAHQEGARGTWDSAAGPNLVLVRDPHGESDQACGTYVVFRKLEQRVRAFKRQEEALAKRLGLPPRDESELAGALIVGRFKDGTPLVLNRSENDDKRQNDFSYKDDPQGDKCPFFAHIRKVNPRGDSVAPVHTELSHRIARRGITYGDPTPPSDDPRTWPARGVGLLFQCCQADLKNQFEFIQRHWANNLDRVRGDDGRDAMIGQARLTQMSVPVAWSDSNRVSFRFSELVRMRGGEYFFAPSISGLKRICDTE